MTTGVDPVRTFVENFSVESYTALQGAQLDALLLAKARELLNGEREEMLVGFLG